MNFGGFVVEMFTGERIQTHYVLGRYPFLELAKKKDDIRRKHVFDRVFWNKSSMPIHYLWHA